MPIDRVLFRNPESLRKAHPDIDFDLIVSKSAFKKLVATYKYGGKLQQEHCQLLNKKKKCNTGHLNGWVAVTKDGEKGLIGRVCAKHYFGADENSNWFRGEASRIDRMVRLEQKRDALRSARENLSSDDLKLLIENLSNQRSKKRAVKEAIHSMIFSPLKNMSKTGNTAVNIQIQIPEKNEKGRIEYVWHDRVIGSVSGVDITDSFPSAAVIKSVKAANNALELPKLSTESLNDLDTANSTLENVVNLNMRHEEKDREIKRFLRNSNLKLVSVLCTNLQAREEFADSMISIKGGEIDGVRTGRELIKKIDLEIRHSNGDHNWRLS